MCRTGDGEKARVQKSAREESWFNEKKMKKYNISTTEFFVHFARIFFFISIDLLPNGYFSMEPPNLCELNRNAICG